MMCAMPKLLNQSIKVSPILTERSLAGSAGLSLLEVLIALALVSVALLALSNLSTISVKGTAAAKKLTIGTMLAQEKLEDLRTEGHDLSQAQNVSQVEDYGSFPGYPKFKRTTTSEPNVPGQNMQTVTVTVQWDQDLHSVKVSTILAE